MSRELLPDWRIAAITKELSKFDPVATGQRLRKALSRERAHSAEPDGIAGGHAGGSSSGGPKIIVDNEQGEPESVDVTAVELAVIQRQHQPTDPYHAALDRAGQAYERAARELDRVLRALDAIDLLDELRDDDAGLTPEPGCWAMARVESWEPVFRNTTLGGHTFPLGRWAYDWTRTTGRLPSEDECKRHAEGRKVRLPPDVVTKWKAKV